MAFLTKDQLKEIGFLSVGDNVLVSDKASIYNPKKISIGSNVRIDDFCVLSAGSGGITIEDYVHIAVYSSLIGEANITLRNFCNISSKVAIYSSNDDYSGASLTNPMVASEFKDVSIASVMICKHVIIGSGSVVLPGVTLGEGVAIGALSLVNKSCEEYFVYAGSPAKKIKKRKHGLLILEHKFLRSRA